MSAIPVVPRATYRLQFNAGFGFDDARAIVPYLATLGVSHVYASPLTTARPGSTHGYDVIDFNHLNPELGDEAAFEALIETLHAHGMGLLLDFVPNHMGIGPDNPLWLDVLEWGQASPYANFFDIDWEASARGVRGKVTLPVLGDQYGKVLEAGELALQLNAEAGGFHVAYHEHRFPIGIAAYPQILRIAADIAEEGAAALLDCAARFEALAADDAGEDARARRQEALGHKAELAGLAADATIRDAIDAAVAAFNGTPGQPDSFRALHAMLEDQAYRIAFWRVASSEINYRRFFDINDLAGLRMERGEVFEATHRLLLRLVGEGKVQGIRLDHIDGMFDPAGYCRRLLARIADVLSANGTEVTIEPKAGQPVYLLVEKILARHEYLREELAAAGTTGYEFMNQLTGLFVDPAAERSLANTYERFVERPARFAEVLLAAKRQILRYALDSELHVLAHEVHRLAQESWLTRDFTLTGVRDALTDVITRFPVYRTYITDNGAGAEDRRDLDWAISQARKETGIVDRTVFDFLHAALSTDLAGTRDYERRHVIATAMHFQQLTGPVMAKSLEDTALYRYHRLIALNEVGGEPDHFGVSPAAFHHNVGQQQRFRPLSMLASATHDHKRGEDTRARIAALSEMAVEWRRRVRRWAVLNRFRRLQLDGAPVPSRNDEYLLYQTLLGTWPFELETPDDLAQSDFVERIVAYMIKAIREAKQETSWTAQNPDYEAGVEQFVRRILDPERGRAFLADLLPFQERLAVVGAVNGLAQVLLKLTAPGVPDIYQGTEFWDLSLVDPDNRRPVDFDERNARLRRLEHEHLARLLANWRDGAIKQAVVARTLGFRRTRPEIFTAGGYQPLSVDGEHAERIVGFARTHEGAAVIAVAPRLVAPLLDGVDRPLPPAEAWGDTRLVLPDDARGPMIDVLTGGDVTCDGGEMAIGALLNQLPVALLRPTP